MRNRYYTFKKSNGEVLLLTIEQALELKQDEEISKRLREIRANTTNVRRLKDGFEAGYQPNINRFCSSRGEYDRTLKEMGLTEIGKERIPTQSEGTLNPCANEEFVKHCHEIGVDLSGQEEKAILSGEYFDSSKCEIEEKAQE
jgi:hypothetical protein